MGLEAFTVTAYQNRLGLIAVSGRLSKPTFQTGCSGIVPIYFNHLTWLSLDDFMQFLVLYIVLLNNIPLLGSYCVCHVLPCMVFYLMIRFHHRWIGSRHDLFVNTLTITLSAWGGTCKMSLRIAVLVGWDWNTIEMLPLKCEVKFIWFCPSRTGLFLCGW